MIEFIGGLFSFAFGLVKMGFTLAGDLLAFVFGLLEGLFSLLISLGGILLAGALILVAVFRRKAYKDRRAHPYEDAPQGGTYDVDTEEFTSFYDQYKPKD